MNWRDLIEKIHEDLDTSRLPCLLISSMKLGEKRANTSGHVEDKSPFIYGAVVEYGRVDDAHSIRLHASRDMSRQYTNLGYISCDFDVVNGWKLEGPGYIPGPGPNQSDAPNVSLNLVCARVAIGNSPIARLQPRYSCIPI